MDRQAGLLPGGLAQIEPWLPGLTREAQDLGGVLVGPGQRVVHLDGHQHLRNLARCNTPAGGRRTRTGQYVQRPIGLRHR